MIILRTHSLLKKIQGGIIGSILINTAAHALSSGSAYYKECQEKDTCSLQDASAHAATGAIIGLFSSFTAYFFPFFGPIVTASLQPMIHPKIKKNIFGPLDPNNKKNQV
jgi:hypothetical protein